MVTLEDVLIILEREVKPGEFDKSPAGCIRSHIDRKCPGCYAASLMGLNPNNHRIAIWATGLEMPVSDRCRLMAAADNVHFTMEESVRDRLLKACKL